MVTTPDVQTVDAASVQSALTWHDAISALRQALQAGLEPEDEPCRGKVAFGSGQLLMMPSTVGNRAGIKLATVTPANPRWGLPRIQATYLLFDAATLTPIALLDGIALTAVRTAAVSALAVDHVAPVEIRRLVVFGSGPQAHGHVQALRAVRQIESVGVVARDASRTAAFVRWLRANGLQADVTSAGAVAEADLVACCTTAREPLFDGRMLSDTAVVVACGSHEPDAREVDGETVRRCGVLVESVSTARVEAGDVVLAIAEAAISVAELVGLAAVVRGETRARPRLIKTVGMGWEDLVVASAVVQAITGADDRHL